MESASTVAQSFMLAQYDDDFRELGDFRYGQITFVYLSVYLGWVVAAYVHYVVGTADKATHPTKEWKNTTIVIALLLSSVWGTWIANQLFDNRGGDLHSRFMMIYRISLAYPIVIIGFAFYLLGGYGT